MLFTKGNLFDLKVFSLNGISTEHVSSKLSYFIQTVRKYPEAATRGVLWKKVFLEILQNLQENTCARVSFFTKVAGLRAVNLLKKRLRHRCFPVNFAKLLRTPFLQNSSQRTASKYRRHRFPKSLHVTLQADTLASIFQMFCYIHNILLYC